MENNKLVMIVIDGLRYETARQSMGYMNHLIEKKIATVHKVKSELPSVSRPLYETLLTGVAPFESGIVNNGVVRNSHYKSLFHLVKENGGVTAAAAYHWVSELYNSAPFDYLYDCEQHNEEAAIMHGRFYFNDSYPDSQLLVDAEILRKNHNPDFLYIHPMGMDDIGHKYGGNSGEYRNNAIYVDSLLGKVIPLWQELGYQIVVTSDHGMNDDGNHGGDTQNDRDVPLFIISPKEIPLEDEVVPQLKIAPLMCYLMGISTSKEMHELQCVISIK